MRLDTYLSDVPIDIATSEHIARQTAETLDQNDQSVTQDSSPGAKIKLFRSLFRGRTDVFPVRFESQRTGKAGYSPACANEWVRGVCEKPRIRCVDCPNRRFIPVTDEVIRWHLSGRDSQGRDFVMGVYPMLHDETCHFLAADFDKESWREDAGAFLDTCRRFSLPAALERSRSGNGCHVWLFFEDAVSASLARKLGSHVLTETMERRPEVGFGSYDRLFPNQDTLHRRVWKSDCIAFAKAGEAMGKHRLYRRAIQAICRPVVASGGAVPLPIDPEWKRDYTASVRRLTRDGVETPLANLFVHATRPPFPEAEGADRARSASEVFLYRRLETLPETAGRFRLNVELPIPFDAWGRMEVDFFFLRGFPRGSRTGRSTTFG